MRVQVIHVHVLKHQDTGLLMAVSDDLPGLIVHGRSEAELETRIPNAIRDLLEASGGYVESVTMERDKRHVPEFGPPAFIANAALTNNPVRRDA